MDTGKNFVKRPNVLRKLNTESLQLIERGLLGDLPDKLKPPPLVPVRGNSTALVVAKPSGFLSSCLPVVPNSPKFEVSHSSEDEPASPLKKTFSFRDKFTRIRQKWKGMEGEESPPGNLQSKGKEQEYKSSKRFWFFRNKELMEKRSKHKPSYMRSKSFEFLPRAIEEENDVDRKSSMVKNQSYAFGSSDTINDPWSSTESLEYISNVYYDNDDTVFLKSIKEFPSESSNNNSGLSNATSASSGIVLNIMKGKSMQGLLEEFEKTVDMFSESYLSDCEPYTKTNGELSVEEKRKSASWSNLPSPKVMQVNKVNRISEDFKSELSRVLSVKRKTGGRTARRGSVTDWFVLEDKTAQVSEQNKYKRAQKKPTQRVRRISSTKYWITPEECAVFSRERKPPLVIPRIQYRAPRRENRIQNFGAQGYEESAKEWSPASDRGSHLDRGYGKITADSPPFVRLVNKKLGGSTENIVANLRPTHLHLPASSSGDSLDVEVRERETAYSRSRKSKSVMVHKRSPVPAPRRVLPPAETYERSESAQSASQVVDERFLKRTKYSESGKKSKKNWTECYMVLTNTALYFYKDQRTYQATKMRKPGTPPSPTAPRAELILPLRNAHVLPCIQSHTRRYTRSCMLTVGYDIYLLQDETDEKAKTLLKLIQSLIYKLGPPTLDEYAPQQQSSNTDLESLGRTPPAARHATRKHKAGGSSNEDLSDSTEISTQKSQVSKVLRKFFPKRPTMEDLVKKGIYKDEPVFGRKLEEVCSETSPRIPDFVRACVKEIESSEENMCTDGLYRASGNLSQVQKIRLEIDQKNQSVIANNTDIHVLTGALKLFFRELKEPLIPCSKFDRVLAACSIKPREARIKEFRDIIQSLPECNRDTLKFLLEHLLRVTQYSERNRMHTANLAIVFGPTLLWAPAEQAHNIAIDCIQQNNVVDILLNDYHDIFEKKKA